MSVRRWHALAVTLSSALIAADPDGPTSVTAKQRHTVKRIYDQLIAGHACPARRRR
jgi:hypothetical protein